VRLAIRYAAMRASPFAFLRATCHLFYARARQRALLPAAPAGWISGDLHLENFGSFRGANGLACFDINDFDEAALAPGTWDMLRLATSILVWARTRHRLAGERRALAKISLNAFADALMSGRPQALERTEVTGAVRTLLRQVERRSAQTRLNLRTERRDGTGPLCLRLDPFHALPAPRLERIRVTSGIERFAAGHPNPQSFRVLDVARRVAGLGSLGLPRWLVLVEGNGSPNGCWLLDIKAARRSSAAAVVRARQPRWPSDAARIVAVERQLQAEPPALLSNIALGREQYIIRELQPERDRLHLGHLDGEPAVISEILQTMGRQAAFALLRGAGQRRAARAAEWVDFARGSGWRGELLHRARELAHLVHADWIQFAAAYDAGQFVPRN
jgi:uncharacterized protein (DUF2252 family)